MTLSELLAQRDELAARIETMRELVTDLDPAALGDDDIGRQRLGDLASAEQEFQNIDARISAAQAEEH